MTITDWRKPGRRLAILALLGGLAASTSSPGARAFNPQPEPPGRWGLFGIVADQTARVSVVNTSGDPGGYPPGPCRVTLAFVDVEGTVLKEALMTLRPGQATSLDYGFQAPPEPDRGEAIGATGDRLDRQDLRARIGIVNLAAPPEPERPHGVPPGPCVPSVEVFETATGRTAFLVAEAPGGPSRTWWPRRTRTAHFGSGPIRTGRPQGRARPQARPPDSLTPTHPADNLPVSPQIGAWLSGRALP
jgi:hypothetical protein